jgi:hypothetical protein
MKGKIMGQTWDETPYRATVSHLVRALAVVAGTCATIWLTVRFVAYTLPLGWSAAVLGHEAIDHGYGLAVGVGLAAMVVVGLGIAIVGSAPPARHRARRRSAEHEAITRRTLVWLPVSGVLLATVMAGIAAKPALLGILGCLAVAAGMSVGAAVLAGWIARGLGALVRLVRGAGRMPSGRDTADTVVYASVHGDLDGAV